MDTEHTFDEPPPKLIQRIQSTDGSDLLRMRAVVTRSNGSWKLICCTVESFISNVLVPDRVPSRRYEDVLLEEQWWSRQDCLTFISELMAGEVRFGDETIKKGPSCQWVTEFKAAENDVMTSGGIVISLYFDRSGPHAMVTDLLSVSEPYYPDHAEAARDWLPFLNYHGSSDGRNGCVVFLLPETKAFITGAEHSQNGILEIHIGGNRASSLDLLIKGAYWQKQKIHHLEAPVIDASASLIVPQEPDRLEYFLMDRNNNVYGFHKEAEGIFRSSQNYRTQKGSLNPVARLRQSLQKGEGQQIEFKQYLDIDQKPASQQTKVKLQAVAETVVALSNSTGGFIYLGVSDDCTIVGIKEKIAEWAKEDATDIVVNQYIGALKSRLKGAIDGEVDMDISPIWIDGLLVVAIDVPPAAIKPVSIHQDKRFYVRSGSSNRKLAPREWASAMRQTNDIGSNFN